ncbi:MAG: flagellar biosynthesis protein FlhB [Negativicutes bacterium]|nr:flagellar biosynthesis protein FlhB [Negativicutes bacterium]
MKCIKAFTASWPHSVSLSESTYQLESFDLQLFAGEKTEEATSKRRQESRKKGQVARSTELSSAFVILSSFLALKILGPHIYNELTAFMRFTFSHFSTADITLLDLQVLFINLSMVMLKTALPVMISILVVSLAVNFLQVGVVFSLEPLMPSLDKINPLSGLQRMFSLRSLVELVKSIIKILIIGFFIYRFMAKQSDSIPQLISADLFDTLQLTASLSLDLAFQIGAVMLVLAALDYFYQWWQHNQSIKMSKQEVKEEYKQIEGNPLIKSKIKERQRALAMRRMMQEVPKATAVVTNPTHFAVAIKYNRTMSAPEVVAKGQDFLAERIKTLAKENGVAIVENKPLARALFSTVEIGDSIPPELYQAVAEVLAYVYRLKKRLS